MATSAQIDSLQKRFNRKPDAPEPIFEAIAPDGNTFKVYASGHTEGFPDGMAIINKVAQIVSQRNALQAEVSDLRRALVEKSSINAQA